MNQAMTTREVVRAVEDIEGLQCWGPGAECWCGRVHGEAEAGLVPPPWVTETGEDGGNA